MGQYVALLRGINVGGKNLIKMTALKACLDDHGFRSVVTYIQSGNVLFESGDSSSAKLARRIEAILAATFDYRASVVLRTRQQLRSIVEQAPDRFGTQPARYRYDVIFLKPPLSAVVAIKSVPTKAGVDQAYAGSGVAIAGSHRPRESARRRRSKEGDPSCDGMLQNRTRIPVPISRRVGAL
jgi:uncharacterized protein (DUF1697 family)